MKCGICQKKIKKAKGKWLVRMPKLASDEKDFIRINYFQYEIVRYCEECWKRYCLASKGLSHET